MFGGIGSSPLIEDGIAYVGAVGVWAVSVHTGAVLWHFNLSSVSSDQLDTFVGASHRRVVGLWEDMMYVAGEDGCLYTLNTTGASFAHGRRVRDGPKLEPSLLPNLKNTYSLPAESDSVGRSRPSGCHRLQARAVPVRLPCPIA